MLRDIAETVAPVLLPIVIAYAAEMLRRCLNIQADSEAAKAINIAVERAAGRVYQHAIQAGVSLSDVPAIDNLTVNAARDAEHRVGSAMVLRGVGTTEFAAMVQGAFARALVTDPTIAGPQPGPKE